MTIDLKLLRTILVVLRLSFLLLCSFHGVDNDALIQLPPLLENDGFKVHKRRFWEIVTGDEK